MHRTEIIGKAIAFGIVILILGLVLWGMAKGVLTRPILYGLLAISIMAWIWAKRWASGHSIHRRSLRAAKAVARYREKHGRFAPQIWLERRPDGTEEIWLGFVEEPFFPIADFDFEIYLGFVDGRYWGNAEIYPPPRKAFFCWYKRRDAIMIHSSKNKIRFFAPPANDNAKIFPGSISSQPKYSSVKAQTVLEFLRSGPENYFIQYRICQFDHYTRLSPVGADAFLKDIKGI